MYAEPAAPTWAALNWRPEPSSVRRPPMAPTMVTARPSRIQTVPRPMITIQCHLDQGNRSIRAGMFVSIVRNVVAPAMCFAMCALQRVRPAVDDLPSPWEAAASWHVRACLPLVQNAANNAAQGWLLRHGG